MICIKCNTFHRGFAGRLCPVCSEPLQFETEKNRNTLILRKFREYAELWQKKGLISKSSANEISSAVEKELQAPSLNEASQESPGLTELFFLWLRNLLTSFFSGFAGIIEPEEKSYSKYIHTSDRKRKRADSGFDSVTESAFGEEGEKFSGIDAVSDLDRRKKSGRSDVGETVIWSGLKPLFNEYIWWFIGTVLVLAGSVMGIREAWMSLSGMYRHFTVAGGVLLYQTLFCGLGIFLGSKSKATGKILSGISLLLFPVLFSAASDIVSLNFIIGAGAVGVFSAASVFLLKLISSQFETELKKLILPVLPSGIILAFLPSLGQGYGAAGVFFAALIPVFFISADLENSEGKEGKFFLLLGLYGTFSVFTVYTAGPSNGQTAVFPMQKGFILLWILVFCEITAFRFGNIGKKSAGMNLFYIFEILLLSAVLVIASMSSFEILKTSSFRASVPNERLLLLILPAASALIFLHSVKRHIPALHIFMILSISACFILGNELLLNICTDIRFQNTDWVLAFSVIVPVSGLFLAERFEEKIRTKLLGWGLAAGSAAALCLTVWKNGFTSVWLILPAGIFGLYFLSAAHFAGGFRRSASHLAAALGTVCSVSFIISYLNLNNAQSHLGIIFGVTSILYSLSGFYFDSKSENREDLSLFRPLDDNSLISAFLSAAFLSNVTGNTGLLENSLVLFTGLNLIFRSFRDKSVLISFLGVFILSLSIMRHLFSYFTEQNTADTALIAALTALVLQTGAVIFPNAGKPTPKARKMFTAVRLPFPADGLSLLHYALSSTSVIYIAFSISQTVIWFGLAGQPDRNLVITANILIALIFCISFVTHSSSMLSLKGSTAALALVFLSAGLAAVANRIGRPLPPSVVGTNLTLGIGALWLFSRLLFHKGPVISAWLENPEQGKTYHFVPLASMVVLSLVLFADIFLIGLPTFPRLLYITPPTFFLGIALAAFLFGRSVPNRISMHIASCFSLFFITLSFAQSGILGIALYPLDIPGGRWVPSFFQASQTLNWLNPAFFLPADLSVPDLFRKAALGISAAGVLYAALSLIAPLSILADIRKKFIWTEAEALSDFFSGWSVICIMLIAAFSFSYAALPPGIGLAAASVILIVSHRTDMGLVSLALSGLIITEGFAFTGNTFPFWTGPLLAGIGLLLVLSVKQVSEFFKKPFSRVLESSHIGAFIYSGVGILYALAYTVSSDGNNSALSLLSGSAQGLFGGWMLYPVLGITFMLITASLFAGSIQWKETLSTAGSAGAFLFTAVSLLSLFPFGCSSAVCTKGTGTMLLEMFPWFSAITAITAGAAFTASVYSEERRKDFSAGSAYSSDILIVCTGIFLGVFMRVSLQSSLKYSDFAGLAAISTVIFISLSAAYRNRMARHLYFAQTAIASLYLALKPAFPDLLNAQADAVAALIFGFILTGVTAAAHRAGVPTLAESTRRFAAFMPVIASLVLPAQANYQNAGMAAFSAALYAALSTVSSNRIYAVLAAASANLSIFTAVMASQVQGIEVYLAPFGLFSLLLGQIFRENLSDSVRKIIRLAGGLLLYLPAAFKISFEIGQGADAMYAVVFGLLCLIGIAAGMIFQIRSYLFMGTVFFTLNLGVNVIQVGLRDQKAGFLLLSITGILIITALVFYTVKKDFVATYLSRLNKALSRWD